MAYPPAPWSLHGQLWLSLFRTREEGHPGHAPGVYGVALVSYERPSPLVYSELLVARLAPSDASSASAQRSPLRPAVEITDIWVDSIASRDGGRELWAIPKDLCDFRRTTSGRWVQRTAWSTTLAGLAVASAHFTDVSAAVVRVPFRGSTRQQRDPGPTGPGEVVTAQITGSARIFPCSASWTFEESGPLAWLAGKRPLASFRMNAFSMTFG